MEQITLFDENNEEQKLYVLEETTLAGNHYLLLCEEPEGDSDAYIFREESSDSEEEATYTPVEDDKEYDAVLSVFEKLLEDTDFE
ncbi:MAG: DUF1292 domain-containing protein [Lachnospiraceae bacterium]|jgi:uncharacterized protein YrzB (UPF0473 family)|nr:DUF1292 domain-containing protein [Lachnospiraceae bacterium]MDD6148940.1 DUF1292 domain-containing protein [Lachnospiraceae bacterium]MDY5703755.1 DUF1292 domain-containing protein [Lachnospiraceae bacterium]MEE3356730.1 DUF1292 domain-containing protein [Lachnospiraceae bacterium]